MLLLLLLLLLAAAIAGTLAVASWRLPFSCWLLVAVGCRLLPAASLCFSL